MNKIDNIDFEKRLEYLEKTNLFKMMALDLTKEFGEFHSSINKLEDPGIIFEKSLNRIKQIIEFEKTAFLLVDESTSEFKISVCEPQADKNNIEKEIEILIDDGTFSRAIREKKPITAYSIDFKHQMLLHVLSTVSRVRGMFVGVLTKNSKHIQEASFELFSILMAHCANTLESFELYYQLRQSNIRLEEKVRQLSISESCLKDEIIEHKKTEKQLKLSEEQYRLLAETANEMIFVVSRDGTIKYANKSSLRASGYSRRLLHEMNIQEIINDIDSILHDDEERFSSVYETSLKTQSLETIPLEINIAKVIRPAHEYQILIVGRDVSQRIRSEKEKRFLEEKLWQAQKHESIGLLASGIAHDFNNILSIIMSFTSVSLSELPEDSRIHSNLTKVSTASKRAITLARKLYTIGKKDDHKKERINVLPIISETIDLLRSSMPRMVKTELQVDDSHLFVNAEETRIQQILMNLITNAIHAIGQNTGTIKVSAEKKKITDNTLLTELDLNSGSYIKFLISDNGPGIEPWNIKKIFDPYFSTKDGKDNSGLGLAVAHGIVNNYSGAISVESNYGEGTTFSVYLPEAKL